MFPLIIAAAVVAVLIIVQRLLAAKEARENRKALQHMIEVNLSILKNELDELNGVAGKSRPSDDVAKAKRLLAEASAAHSKIHPQFATASETELLDMLTELFSAMGKATEARHLLDACVPMIGE